MRTLVTAPFTRNLLDLTPLDATHWALTATIAFAYLGFVELDKAIHRRLSRRRE